MTVRELYDVLEGHEALEGVSVCVEQADPHVVVRHNPSGLLTRVHVNALAKVTWEQLEKVLTGAIEPRMLEHMTRCVGYFSRVSNWNRSKLGELRARITGQYGLEGDRTADARASALEVVDMLAG